MACVLGDQIGASGQRKESLLDSLILYTPVSKSRLSHIGKAFLIVPISLFLKTWPGGSSPWDLP